MRRKNTSFIISAILVSALLCPGCATFMERRTQQIPVTSTPVGATVSLNGRPQGVTPLVISVARKVKDQVLRIESPGYNPLEIRVKRRVSAGKLIMDVVLGAASGLGAALLYAAITREPWVTTEPDAFDSEDVLTIAVPLGIIGFPIAGLASGKLYSLSPAELTVTLTKAEGSVRVDTILVDPAELQNVKWIRVRRN